MANFAALQKRQSELIRKALNGSVFVSDITGPEIETLTTGATADLTVLDEAYDDLGWLSTDGAQFGRDVSSSDVTSWGSVGPTRSDITADTTTLTVTCHETKARTIALSTGVDLAALTPDEITGEVGIVKPARPTSKHYRVLSVAVDEGDAGEIYIGRFLPRAKPTSFAEQAFGGGDDPITWGVTLTGYEDSALGYTERWFFGGPGWRAQLVAMGFPPLTP